MCRNLSVPTQASSFVCVLGRICAHSLGTVPAPGARSQHCPWQPPACHRHHSPSPQRVSHHRHHWRDKMGNPTALPPLGPCPEGIMNAQPQRVLERGGCSWEGLSSVATEQLQPQMDIQDSSPTLLLLCREGTAYPDVALDGPPAPRAALCCWYEVAGTFGREELQALVPRGSGNGAVAPPPWGPSGPSAHHPAHGAETGRCKALEMQFYTYCCNNYYSSWQCDFSPQLLHQQSQQHSSRAWRVGEHRVPHTGASMAPKQFGGCYQGCEWGGKGDVPVVDTPVSWGSTDGVGCCTGSSWVPTPAQGQVLIWAVCQRWGEV